MKLNEEKWRPPKRRLTFNAEMVRKLLSRHRIVRAVSPGKLKLRPKLHANEWLLADLALKLGMPSISLYSWLRRGWVQGRRVADDARNPWILQADAQELARLLALRQAPKLGWRAQPTTPLARA